jgi:hypothetical protein
MNRKLKEEFPYEFMKAKDPCQTCKSAPYCAEASAICVAFDQYVSTGWFDQDSVGQPVLGGYDELLEERGHWRKRVFAS